MDYAQSVKDINSCISSIKSRARRALQANDIQEYAKLMLDLIPLYILLHGDSQRLTEELDKKKAA